MRDTDLTGRGVSTPAVGHPALAYCNVGDFTDYEEFLRWSNGLGWIDDRLVDELAGEADRRPGQASHVLHDVRMLQRAIRATVSNPKNTDGYQVITRMAHQAYADAVLLPGAPARWELGRALETPLYAAALSAVDLLTEVDLRAVRECSVDDCANLYLGAAPGCPAHADGVAGRVDLRAAHVDFERAIA